MSKIVINNDDKKQSYLNVFRSEPGSAVLKDLIKRFYIKHNFDESHATMSWREGRRDVIQHILDMIEEK